MPPPAFAPSASPENSLLGNGAVIQREEATTTASEETQQLPLVDPWEGQEQGGGSESGQQIETPAGLVDPWDTERGPTSEIIDPWDQEAMADLLEPTSGRGWHVVFPSQQGGRRLRFRPGRSGRNRREPSLGNYPRNPEMAPMPDETSTSQRDRIIAGMRRRLSQVTIPTRNGSMNIFRHGYAYTVRNNAEHNPDSRAYREYLRQLQLEDLQIPELTERHRRFWPLYSWIMQEGDPSAINAWDNQNVTIGAGFSANPVRPRGQRRGAPSGQLGGRILNRLPADYRRQLYGIGIHIESNGLLTVLDLQRGIVMHNENAMLLLRTDASRLGFLINAAQSSEAMESDDGSQTLGQRTWMVRAQFETFMEHNSGITDRVLNWPIQSLRFAFKLRHWAGSLSWRSMAATGGDVNALANYAYRRLRNTYDPAFLQRKIRTIAGRGGIGIPPSAIQFR